MWTLKTVNQSEHPDSTITCNSLPDLPLIILSLKSTEMQSFDISHSARRTKIGKVLHKKGAGGTWVSHILQLSTQQEFIFGNFNESLWLKNLTLKEAKR